MGKIMRYLSIDIESTGTGEKDYLIEFAAIPFCSDSRTLEDSLVFETLVKCPSFKDLESRLGPWAREHNRQLINKAHAEGIPLERFKKELTDYVNSPEIVEYFGGEKITLFGKSMASIDIPFLKRDLGWDWFEKYFIHRQLDLSSVAYHLVDCQRLPPECRSGSALMKHLSMGEVAHTALSDAVNTAKMYFKLLADQI